MEVKLVVTTGKLAGKKIPISRQKFVIGRETDCHLQPQSSLISRRHCTILVEEGSVVIEDHGSTNGTYVDGERIQGRKELKNGTLLRVGTLEFEVQLAVSVGGKKKPKVHNVQEAARTVASTSAKGDDLDISNWLEDEQEEDSPLVHERPTEVHDTVVGRGLGDTSTTISSSALRSPEEQKGKKPAPSKINKMHRPTKPMAESSGAAAADMLRQFFHRKKS